MTHAEPSRWARHVPKALVAFGVVAFATDVALEVWFFGPASLLSPTSVMFNVLTLAFTGGIAAAGVWLARSDVEVARYPRVAKWTAAFALTFLAINLFIMLQFPDGTLFGNLVWALWSVYVGGAGGVTVGAFEARAITRAVRAEREAVEAEHVERQRQWLDYLNSILRHEVLNNASIIQGYARLLLEEEDLDPRADGYVETIERQSRDMTDVIRDVRVLVQAADQIEYREPIDVAAVLADELGDLRATYPEVETELTVDGDAYVPADDLLPRIFSNILANAVEHNPSESPSVSVRIETSPEVVRVNIADDGPGVSDAERESLFERSQEDHGLGLYLVRVLAERYDGTVELAETGEDGSVFVVELPRVDASTDEDLEAAEPDGNAAATRPDR